MGQQQQCSSNTFGNQHLLPRLPIPDLQATCDKFLEWVQPLLTDEEFQQTARGVQAFRSQNGDGEKLHRRLIEWSQNPNLTSWLEPFWDDMYLKYRGSLVINMNPCQIYKEHPATVGMTQIQRATMLIRAILQFKQRLDREELEVEMEREQPLCMDLFKRMFSTTRIPRKERDQLRSPYGGDVLSSPSERHIIILYNGHVFTLDVLSDTGEMCKAEDIRQNLETILELGKDPAKEDETVGMLTTLKRDKWADARDLLWNRDPHNQTVFDTIETALFAICLDNSHPATSEELSRTMLHGDGRNRWFDKALQFIVCRNGVAGSNIEHTGFDGSNVMRLVKFIYENSAYKDTSEGASLQHAPRRLDFRLNDQIRQSIIEATHHFTTFVNSLRIQKLEFNEFGKEFIKTCRVSPDGFVQSAMQLAQYKLFGTCHSTY
ncbi:MAG: choline/carnitine O-acyltransferase, partial [bacterium]|nr:choline/carnitine O-acyltransferase [bacterium]